MDVEELETRIKAIDNEEKARIEKVREHYEKSRKVMKKLMFEQFQGKPKVDKDEDDEEEDNDESKYTISFLTYPSNVAYNILILLLILAKYIVFLM